MMGLFKRYDVRGLYPSEVSESEAYRLGRSFARFTKSKRILVGRDVRISSDSLAKSFVQGVNDEGSDVIDIGKCTTPVFYFALCSYGYSAGAMVTASHNPKNYNGFKLCGKSAEIYSYDDGLKKIEDIFLKDDFSKKDEGKIIKKDVFNDYKKFILRFTKGLSRRKVVIDYGNGTEAIFSPKILSDSPIKLVNLNHQVNGEFPAHGPDPSQPRALSKLSDYVKRNKADLGVAFDSDADRTLFVDDKGNLLKADHLLAFVAEEMLKYKEGKRFVSDLTCSRIVAETIERHGGKNIISKVGRANMRKSLISNKADFGGELSGHYFLKEFYNAENGIILLFRILRYLDMEEKKLSSLIKKYDVYFNSGIINLHIDNREDILSRIKANFSGYDIDDIDGISVDKGDVWFNIRLSNTEQILRVVIEGKSRKIVESQKKEIVSFIRKDD